MEHKLQKNTEQHGKPTESFREKIRKINPSYGFNVWTLSGLWMIAIFMGWWIAQFKTGSAGNFGSISMPIGMFSELTGWFPLAAEVSRGNLFPSEPSLGTGLSQFSFYPYISIWSHGFFIALFGIQGADFIGTTLFPLVAFFMLVQIYNRYLPTRWSISLAAVGLIGFVSLPFREFLNDLLRGIGWRELGTTQNLEVAHFPMPAFSLTIFLITFYLSIQNKRLTLRNISPITLLWALQIMVHPINVLLGLFFWFTAFPLRLCRQNQDKNLVWQLRQIAIQGLLAIVVMLPSLWAYYNLGQSNIGFSTIGFSQGEETLKVFNTFYFTSYFILPLLLLGFVYKIYRVDPYEVLIKFWPVLLMMTIEFMVVCFPGVLNFKIPSDLIFTRIGIFFLHFYYFVPFLYYVSRSSQQYHLASEQNQLGTKIKSGLEWFFNSASKVYLVLLWVLLTFYAISSMHQFWIQKKKEAPLLENAWEMTRILNSETPEGKTLVSEEPLVNLLLPVDGRNGTLWISRFSNRVSQETILEALALYAHIFNWTEKEYLSLIMPGEIQQQGVRAIANLSREKIRSSGVGYWLIMGKSSLSDSNAASSYKEKARNIFQNLELKTALRRFKVYKIFSKGPLADWVPVKSKTTHELGNLYFTGQ